MERPLHGARWRRALAVSLVFLVTALLLVAAQPASAAARGQASQGQATGEERAGERGPAAIGEHEDAAGQEHAAAGGAGQEHAAAGEHEAGEGEHGSSWWEVLYKWINFGLLMVLLWYGIVERQPFVEDTFGFPGLKVFLRERREQIVESRDLARERRAEAQRLLEGSSERLDRVDEEIDVLLEDAREDARREKERAEREARERAERVAEMTDRELQAETVAARRELRAHVADLTVGLAERILRDNLTAEDQERLVREHLGRLEERVA